MHGSRGSVVASEKVTALPKPAVESLWRARLARKPQWWRELLLGIQPSSSTSKGWSRHVGIFRRLSENGEYEIV